MGCDYYMITCLKIEFKHLRSDGRPHIEYIELDRVRCWYNSVDGEDMMTEEEYEQCEEKYDRCEEPVILFENNRFMTEGMQSYFTSNRGLLSHLDLSRVNTIKRIQYAEDRF